MVSYSVFSASSYILVLRLEKLSRKRSLQSLKEWFLRLISLQLICIIQLRIFLHGLQNIIVSGNRIRCIQVKSSSIHRRICCVFSYNFQSFCRICQFIAIDWRQRQARLQPLCTVVTACLSWIKSWISIQLECHISISLQESFLLVCI